VDSRADLAEQEGFMVDCVGWAETGTNTPQTQGPKAEIPVYSPPELQAW